jgi:hypothetical protein
MTLSKMSPADEKTVSTIDEALYKEDRVDTTGAHDPDNPDIGRVLKAGDAGCVSGGIAAPVAKEAKYLWFKRFHPGY